MSDHVKEILTEIGYTLRDCGREYRTKPLYRDSDNPNVLCIKKTNGVWIDFKTNKCGNLEELVKLTLNLKDLEEAKDYVQNKAPAEGRVREKEKLKSKVIFDKDSNLSRIIPDHSYWVNRKISKDTVSVFEGGVMKEGRLKDRYVFPIFDKMNNLIGAAGRSLFDSQGPKWKLIGEKSQWVYPFKYNHSYIKESRSVFLVESIGDLLSLSEAGIKNVFVIFGLTPSPKIKQMLIALKLDKIFISLNNDSNADGAGNKAAYKSYHQLRNHFDDHQLEIQLPSKNDFGCMTPQEIRTWKKRIKT